MVLTCIYFLYVSKNWVYLSLFFCFLSYLALAVAFICPESPRWHLVNGRSVEAIDSLNQIAKLNKVPGRIHSSAVFVEDPTAVQAPLERMSVETRSNIGEENLVNLQAISEAVGEVSLLNFLFLANINFYFIVIVERNPA